MPSFYIHLAIGKRYIEKNNGAIKDPEEFYRGTIAPDLTNNKLLTHYGLKDTDDFIYNLSIKVLLNEYLKLNKIESDYDLGVFMHLVSDYIFYNYYLDKSELSKLTAKEFSKSLYGSYDIVNDYLLGKYNLQDIEYMKEIKPIVDDFVNNKQDDDTKFVCLVSEDKLDEFIDYVSDINLEEYSKKIIQAGGNVLP